LATLIEFFDVPPSQDEAFLADWQRERAGPGATLYRSIRDETPVRFVSVAPGGVYDLVHEDGDIEGSGGVIQITTLTAGTETLAAWQRLHAIETTRRGYLGTRLYGGHAGYVAISRWSSPLMVARTQRQPEFGRAFAALPATSQPALYTAPTGSGGAAG
jgi:hypothetical protein